MAPINKLFLLILILAVVALGAMGLRGLLTAPAWAQAAPGGSPPAEAGQGEAGHQEQAPTPGAPPLPNPEEAFKAAASADLTTRQMGLTSLGTLYTASTDETLLKKIESVLRAMAVQGETAGIRQTAVSAMGWKFWRNEKELVQATYDRDPEVQTAAITSLAEGRASAEIDARLQALSNSNDPSIATAAVASLMQRYGNLGVEGSLSLVAALGVEPGGANSVAALQLLRVGRGAIPALMQALASSPNPTERHGAALVIAMLCGGKSPRQEAFAAATQAQYWNKTKDEVLADPDLRPLQVLSDRLLHDTDELTREMCAQALGYLGTEQAEPVLARAVAGDVAAEVRAAAASALMMVPGTAALPALQQAVQADKSPRVRRFAAEALGWMGDPRTIETLVVATKDPDGQVRRLAALQLGRLKAEQALSVLTALFTDPSEDVRWAAVRAVDGLRNREAVPALVFAAQDSSVLVSHAAETALQKLGEVRRSDAHLKQQG